MVRELYGQPRPQASGDHSACEARVSYLARQCAELIGIIDTLRRQRDKANAEARELREALKQRGSL
jgi:uncharacterized coiled-coil DUF342 family protein